eukprot:scaffold878_cov271-Pinguiococcus_pyrenoidosus.AAC.44
MRTKTPCPARNSRNLDPRRFRSIVHEEVGGSTFPMLGAPGMPTSLGIQEAHPQARKWTLVPISASDATRESTDDDADDVKQATAREEAHHQREPRLAMRYGHRGSLPQNASDRRAPDHSPAPGRGHRPNVA